MSEECQRDRLAPGERNCVSRTPRAPGLSHTLPTPPPQQPCRAGATPQGQGEETNLPSAAYPVTGPAEDWNAGRHGAGARSSPSSTALEMLSDQLMHSPGFIEREGECLPWHAAVRPPGSTPGTRKLPRHTSRGAAVSSKAPRELTNVSRTRRCAHTPTGTQDARAAPTAAKEPRAPPSVF